MILELCISVTLLALCWGSFLNVIAYRITYDKPFFAPRSQCPSCSTIIAWYDNIPLLSWFLLRGKCRTCKTPISWVYPFIEFITALTFLTLVIVHLKEKQEKYLYPLDWSMISLTPLIPYFVFFSALILATASDLFAMVIPQLFSVWLIPVGLLFALYDKLAISPLESIIGCMTGYGILLFTEIVFKRLTKKEGIGVGDMELLAMIGSFLGPIGVWTSLMIGTLSGIACGSGYLVLSKQGKNTRIPFGPFLSLGAIMYVLFKNTIIKFFFF